MRRVLGHDQAVDAERQPLLGIDDLQRGDFLLRGHDLRAEHQARDRVAADERVVRRVGVEHDDVVLERVQLGAHLIELVGIGLIEAQAELLFGHADDVAHIVDQHQIALEFVAPQIGVAGDRLVDRGRIVDDQRHGDGVGHGVRVVGVVILALAAGIDVAPVGESVPVQRSEQIALTHNVDDVVAARDQIELAGRGLHAGEHTLVVGEGRVVDADAGRVLKRGDDLVGNIVCPGEYVYDALLFIQLVGLSARLLAGGLHIGQRAAAHEQQERQHEGQNPFHAKNLPKQYGIP